MPRGRPRKYDGETRKQRQLAFRAAKRAAIAADPERHAAFCEHKRRKYKERATNAPPKPPIDEEKRIQPKYVKIEGAKTLTFVEYVVQRQDAALLARLLQANGVTLCPPTFIKE